MADPTSFEDVAAIAALCEQLRDKLTGALQDPAGLLGRLEAAQRYLFVPPGHYYSPIVATDQIRDPFANGGPPQPIDVALDLGAHIRQWETFAGFFDRLPCLQKQSSRYNDRNDDSSYPWADTLVLQAMIAAIQPRTYVEVGSGFSSLAMLDAVDAFCTTQPATTLVEPYPELLHSLLTDDDRTRIEVVKAGVQDAPLEVFTDLKAGDILFIDSTHIVKTGSDVHFELFEVLPRLAKGVYVHFHDIFWPFEYPYHWIFERKHSWNELYALRAFLAGHQEWEIVFFSDYFRHAAPETIRSLCPKFFTYRPGSLWLRKT